MDALLSLAGAVVDDRKFETDVAPLSASAWQQKVETMTEAIYPQHEALDKVLISRERFPEAVFSPFMKLALKTNQLHKQATSCSLPARLAKLQRERLDSMLTIWGGALRNSFSGTAVPDAMIGSRYIPPMAPEKRANLIKNMMEEGMF